MTPTNVWTKCADQGNLCAFTGTRAVRYGKGSLWSETLIFEAGPLGGVRCEMHTSFYGDPSPGVFKECQISNVTGDNVATRATQGEWSPLQSWPVVPVHATLLPSGRVLAHNATNDDLWPAMSVIARVWDPLANSFIPVDSRDATLKSELFCVGFTHLADGSLLTTGAQPNWTSNHDRNVNRFNYFTQTWTREADTAYFRYYASAAAMPNGDVMTFAGTGTSAPAEVLRFDGSWKTLSGMSLTQDFNYYPWGQAAPNGKLFYAGPDTAMRYIDSSGAGSMTELGARDGLTRTYGSYAIFDIGKMLIAGGAQPATNTAVVVDLNGSSPTVRSTSPMTHARRHGNLTILADGSVLATGGYSGSVGYELSNTSASTPQAERWNPADGTWTPLATAQRFRGYHSIGILLPDGRVAVGGTGMPYTTGTEQQNMEIFSPPYLFQATATTSGGGGNYATRSGVIGSVACNNATFGDPVPGTSKTCSFVVAESTTPLTPPTGAVACAAENGSCVLPAGSTSTVYYGASGKFALKLRQSGSVGCNNANFGDPIMNTAKACSYVVEVAGSGVPPADAVDCAAEFANCVVPTGRTGTVYYGANGRFFSSVGRSGSVLCSNATFGDPIFNTAKRCSYVVTTVVAGNVSALPPGAQQCAAEWGTCNLPTGATATVYYGAGTGGGTTTTPGSVMAPRPTINYAPDSVGFGSNFIVTPGQTGTVAKVHLIKLGAVTHANNQGQRLVPLTFTVSGANLQVKAPAHPNIAPPGHYMLFVVDNKGVPSVAKMVQVQQYSVVALVSRQTGKALEVQPGATGSGITVQMMGDAQQPGIAQSWDLLPTDGGFYKLVSRATGMVLSVPGSSMQTGTAVQAITDVSGTHQQWQLTRSTLGYFTVKARHSGFGLQVAGASIADGASVVQRSLTAVPAPNEEWVVMPVGYQRLVGVQSGKVAEVTGRSTAAGAAVAITPNGGDTHQSFRFVPRADGYFSIEAAHSGSGSVIGVAGGSTQAITPLQQQAYSGATSQQWTLVPQRDGTFMLQVRHTGQYMNVLYDKVDTGTPVGQYPDNGGLPNQYWRLVPAVSLDPHQRNVAGRAIAAAHVAGSGWSVYGAASNTIGKPETASSLEALKISAKGVRTGLQLSYRVQNPDGSWAAWVGDNQQAGVIGQSTPIQAFQATLGGTRDSCAVRYRGFVKGSGWQAWSTEGTTAGVAASTTPLTGLQVIVECTAATLAYKP